MAGVAVGGLILYYILKKVSPDRKRELLQMSNEYMKYLPIDRNTSSFISPILDFTNKFVPQGAGVAGVAGAASAQYPRIPVGGGRKPMVASAEIGGPPRGGGGGGGAGINKIKRSVSESRKKFVAARQEWKCATCGSVLDFTYEVDHVIPLFLGGTNEVDNLAACCVSCHKKKTLLERI